MPYTHADFPVNHRPLFIPSKWQAYITDQMYHGSTKFWPSVLMLLLVYGRFVFPVAGALVIVLSFIISAPAGVVIGVVLAGLGWFTREQFHTAIQLSAMVSYSRILYQHLIYGITDLDSAGVDPKLFRNVELVGQELRAQGLLLFPVEEGTILETARDIRHHYDD